MLNIYSQQNPDEQVINGSEPVISKKADFRKYFDSTGEFDNKELSQAMWYVRHKVLFYRLALAGLVSVSLVLWGYSLFNWGNYLVNGYAYDRRLETAASQFLDYTATHARFAPEPFGVLSTSVLPGGVNKSDAISFLSNPDTKWLARFDYNFVVGGEETPVREGWLMPGETKPFAEFGVQSGSGAMAASVKVDNVRWRRITNRITSDAAAWQEERLKFEINNFSYIKSGTAATTSANANIIRFNLKNAGAFGYKSARFYAGLYNGEELVGMIPFSAQEFASLETRAIDLRSFVPNLFVTGVKVFPQIDLYDQDQYLAPPAGGGAAEY